MTFSCPTFTAVTPSSGQNCSTQLLYKNATSTDVSLSATASTYTITASASHNIAGIILDAPGATFDPTPTSSGQLLSAAGTSFTVSGVTTTHANDQLLWFGASRSPLTTDSAVITIPTGYQELVSQVTTTNSSVNVGAILATNVKVSAGATGSTTGTLGNAADDGGGLLVAINQPARQRRVGIDLGNSAGDISPSSFISIVGSNSLVPRYRISHWFFSNSIPSSFSSKAELVTEQSAGRRVMIDFELTHYGFSNGTYGSGGTPAAGAVTDAANLANFIESCLAGGLDLTLCLWHEPFNKFNTGTQTQNNLDYTNSMGYYGAVLRAYGIPVIFNPSNYSADNYFATTIGTSGSPGLGWAACSAGYIDEVRSDFYVNENGVSNQGTLTACANLADAFSLPFGMNELGYAPADTTSYSQTDVNTFSSYALSFFNSRQTAGKPISDIIFWGTNDNAVTSGMYLPTNWTGTTITNYQNFFDTFDQETGTNVSVTGVTANVAVAGLVFTGITLPGTVANVAVAGKPGSTLTTSGVILSGVTSTISVSALPGTIPVILADSNVQQIYWNTDSSVSAFSQTEWATTAQRLSTVDAIDWNIYDPVSAFVSSQWDTDTRTKASCPSLWNVDIRKTRKKKILFNVCFPIVAQKNILWNTKKKIDSSVAVAWNVNERITLKRPVHWNVRRAKSILCKVSFNDNGLAVSSVSPTTWMYQKRVTANSTSDWVLQSRRIRKKKIFFNVRNPVIKQFAIDWNVRKKVSPSVAVGWNVNQRIKLKKRATWKATTRYSTEQSSYWVLRKIVSPQKRILWNVPINPVTSTQSIEWNTLLHV